jgi:hypothetical protein
MTTKTVAITHRPARDRFEAYRVEVEGTKDEFYRTETALLQVLTKAQLMATGDVAIHESYSKAELIEDAVKHRWEDRQEVKEYNRLMHLESRESEIVDSVTTIQTRLREALDAVGNLAKGNDISSLEAAMNLVKQIRVMHFLWLRVAEVTGPNKREPLDAIRYVAEEATLRALDALEDNSTDLFAHRVTARWIRRNEHLIKALEYYV